ncbi:protein phosphatase 1 regulatory subunit 3D-like [Eucyclogobius newberryi]|uniref:protein phosphatase 1 regulatory subunit 3D-like n=1 Tax=Eucyclogobius newberryi TaxID=166745 RepID=UPI003B59C2B0
MHKDWFIGHERISPSKSEQQMPGSSSTGPRPSMTINLTQILRAENPKAERTPVPIRPPSSSKATVSRKRDPHVSFSCEPTPKPIIRRSLSLPPSSQKKTQCRNVGVRFVDSLGLDLEDVRLFKKGDDPSVPPHVTFRLLMGAELADGKHLEISLPYLKPVFEQQPADDPHFMHRLEKQKICLERVFCLEFGIIGFAQVLNLDFEKEVIARFSFTDWKSSTETQATWMSSVTKTLEAGRQLSCDTFRFHLTVPPFLQPGAELEFAIRYNVRGCEYWDNNKGKNYKLVCESYKLSVPRECEDSMVHFI